MKTIHESINEIATEFPEKTVIRYLQNDSWEYITYSELEQAVKLTAQGLAELGEGVDSKISIMSENRPEWVVSYFAVVSIGAIAIPIDATLGEIETEHIIKHSETRTIICSMKCYDVICRILNHLPNLHNIILLDRNILVKHHQKGEGQSKEIIKEVQNKNNQKNFMTYEEIMGKGIKRLLSNPHSFHLRSDTDLASILYTSGTTGSPKGVMLTHRNFMSNVEGAQKHLLVTENDNFLVLLPLHHAFTFTACMLLPLSKGGKISFVDIMSRDRTRLIMECQPTVMLGVPMLYSKIYKGIMRQIESSFVKRMIFNYGGKKIIGNALKKNLGGKIRVMVSGAAPMDPSVIEGFAGIGINFMEGYGLSETSPVVSCNPLNVHKIKIGSVGTPLNGVEVKIFNPDSDGIGEIAVKGDTVMQGYYKNPELTAKVLQNGWFFTGDLGKIDSDNFIFITGRAKDVIVTSGGKKVYPEIVENLLSTSKFIAESLVLGYKTRGEVGEGVGVLIFPDYEALLSHAKKEGLIFEGVVSIDTLTEDAKDEIIEKYHDFLEKEVKSRMDKLAPYQRITRISIERDEFSKTSTKKIKRFLYKGRLEIADIG